jgi:hypothetical protein
MRGLTSRECCKKLKRWGPELKSRIINETRFRPTISAVAATVKTGTPGSADLSEVVVLAVWYTTAQEIIKQLGSKCAGKIIVDIANPLNSTYDGLAVAPDTSSAEELAKLALPVRKSSKRSTPPSPGRWFTARWLGSL